MSSSVDTGVDKKGISRQSYILSLRDIFIIICGFIISRGYFTSYLMPFSYALYGYVLYYDRRKWWLGISMLLGIFSTGEYFILIKNFLVFFIMTFAYEKMYKHITRKWQVGLVVSLSVVLVGLCMNIFGDNYLFDTTLVILEGLLSFSLFYIYSIAINLFINRNRKVYSSQEIVCLGIFVSILILGLSKLNFRGISLSAIISIFLILLFSYQIGVGVSAPLGMILGLVQNLSMSTSPLSIIIYGLCGIVSGVFKDAGKALILVGFIIGNAMMTFYLNGSTEVFIKISEILIAGILFLIIPNKVWKKVHFFNYDKVDESYQIFCKERINENLRMKLNKYSILLRQMGASFLNNEDDEDREVYHRAFDKVTDSVCKSCYLASKCWKTDINNTYYLFLGVAQSLEKDIDEYKGESFEELRNKCINDEAVLEAFKLQIEFVKIEKEMYKRIKKNNLFVSQQFQYLGQLMDDLKSNINDKWIIRSEEERDILIELDKHDINIDKLFVMQEKNNRYKVTITSGKRLNEYLVKKEIPRLLSEVLNTNMALENETSSDEVPGHNFIYRELSPYRISTGLSAFSKKKGEKSGDIFSDITLENGNRVLALCDGMGVGDLAYRESDTTMSLLEKFMEADIDKSIMVKNINSILMLRDEREAFSTLDYVVFDQFTGIAEFNKIGAAITLIVQKGEVKLIRGQSLPVGILDEISIESVQVQMDDGDLIVMMTDGIFECYDNPEEVEKWVIDTVGRIKSKNPQKIADRLLSQFNAICCEPKDDITILVGRIWRI